MADCKACGAWFGTVTPQDLCPTCERALNRLNGYATPAVHGRWIEKKEWHFGRWVAWFECSECGTHDDNSDMYEMMPFCNLSNYCPNCGAKMDEVSE